MGELLEFKRKVKILRIHVEGINFNNFMLLDLSFLEKTNNEPLTALVNLEKSHKGLKFRDTGLSESFSNSENYINSEDSFYNFLNRL